MATATSRSQPQEVDSPCCLVGTLLPDQSTWFRVNGKHSEPITIDVLARRIGSSLDPLITLFDDNGRERPDLIADDTPGLQGDCRLTFRPTAPFRLEIRDTTYRGGPAYAYRIRIGSFPTARSAFPLAVSTNASAQVELIGNAKMPPVQVIPHGADAILTQSLSPRWANSESHAGWPVTIRRHPWPEIVEAEPNDTRDQANRLPIPGGVSARFATNGDTDRFRIAARQSQPLRIVATTQELGLTTELFLRIRDRAGKEVARSNPTRDPLTIDFQPPNDDDYWLCCESLSYQYHQDQSYHIAVIPRSDDIAVTLSRDRLIVPQGGVGFLPVVGVDRIANQATQLDWAGDPRVRLNAIIPAEVNAKAEAPHWVPIRTTDDAQPGLAIGRVLARQPQGKIATPARFRSIVESLFAGLKHPPTSMQEQVAVAIIPPLPYRIIAEPKSFTTSPGSTISGTISCVRESTFTDELLLQAELPTQWKADLTAIQSNMKQVRWSLTIPKGAEASTVNIPILAMTEVHGPAMECKIEVTIR
jgi:hypothetical protein